MKARMKHPVQRGKKPQLIAPVNALDEKTAKTLYENQKIVIEYLMEFNKQVLSIKRDMNKEIEKRIQERLGDYVYRIESALDGVIALKEIFIEEGLITREEYNEQKAKMRKK